MQNNVILIFIFPSWRIYFWLSFASSFVIRILKI